MLSDATAEPPPESIRNRIARTSGSSIASASAVAIVSAPMIQPPKAPYSLSPRWICPTPWIRAITGAPSSGTSSTARA
jgi:hypothetical protein